MHAFTETYKNQGESLLEDYYELLFQAGIYRKGQWGLIRTCLGSFSDCTNDFGAVLPEYKKDFKRKYGSPSVEEQSRILREQIELIPNLHDPWRVKEMLEHGLMDENGFVPLGKKRALEILEEKDKSKAGRVIDFFTRMARR